MDYRTFKKTYKWMLKKYPRTDAMFPSDDRLHDIIGQLTSIHCVKNGKAWAETRREEEDVTRTFYCNAVDAIPFFRGLGGKEIVKLGYTKYGYIPIEIHSISPDGQQKTIRQFHIK